MNRLFFILLFMSSFARANAIWWEAEHYEHGYVPVFTKLDEAPIDETLLSNQLWVGRKSEDNKEIYRAKYSLRASESGRFNFYVRKHWYNDDFRYRFDEGHWIDVEGTHLATLNGGVSLNSDLRVDWMTLESVDLRQGEFVFEIEFTGVEKQTAIDCFVLSKTPFYPAGLKRPESTLTKSDNGFWSFDPRVDPHLPEALWDLRKLNEKVAGQHGYIKLAESGNSFALGDGSPVRFWSMNTLLSHNHSLDELRRHAKHLAKRGFNMVRFHGAINSKTDDLFAVDQIEIDRSWRLVAAMKAEGIYSTLSPYWGPYVKRHPSWTDISSGSSDNLSALLFFDPTLQAAYKEWLRKWLLTKNPYTGIPLAQDPAVAIIQIQNEDSLLFWTQKSLDGAALRLLERQFGTWLKQKYGSLEKANLIWGDIRHVSDDFSAGYVGIHPIDTLVEKNRSGLSRRLNDQFSFFVETMRNWNAEVGSFLEFEIGYKGLVNAGNWRTANNVTMLDAERWSYAANDVMALNRFYGGGVHINPVDQAKTGYRISDGDLMQGESVLVNPRQIPVNIKHVDGFPTIVSESTWAGSQAHQAEAPFVVAAYGSLTGLDGYYWFSTRVEAFDTSLVKFPAASPVLMATYPAAALLYRRGYLQEGNSVVIENRTLRDILARKPSVIIEDSGFDPNRDKGSSSLLGATAKSIDPLSFLVGPVLANYRSESSHTELMPIEKYVDLKNGTITSNTAEIVLDFRNGLLTIDNPHAQGVTGFVGKHGEFQFSDMYLKTNTEYLTFLAIAMDNKPIGESQTILLQFTTKSQPYGYKTEPLTFHNPHDKNDLDEYEGFRILDQGTPPMNIQNHDVTLTLSNTSVNRATVTDIYGYAVTELELDEVDRAVSSNNASVRDLRLTIPPDAVYVVLSSH